MRAERALEKLRLSLTARGVTSTALAKSAAIGSGGLVGWLAKFSPFTALNKAPTSYAAFATIGAATVVSYEKGGSLESLSFKVYLICFGVGLIFTLLSAVTGHIFGGHGDGAADGHADGSFHGQGHAEAGGNAHDMPGFSPLSPTTIATFITAFGGFGMIMEQIPYLQSPWMSVPIASLGALGIAAMVFMFFRILFQSTQASSEGHVAQLIGLDATVITPIQPGAVGEIAYVQGGTRYSAPARSDASEWLLAGTTVKITRVVGTQFYVIALQPSAVAR
jgi:membrane protein implicated in regulation of membrane protease activity